MVVGFVFIKGAEEKVFDFCPIDFDGEKESHSQGDDDLDNIATRTGVDISQSWIGGKGGQER